LFCHNRFFSGRQTDRHIGLATVRRAFTLCYTDCERRAKNTAWRSGNVVGRVDEVSLSTPDQVSTGMGDRLVIRLRSTPRLVTSRGNIAQELNLLYRIVTEPTAQSTATNGLAAVAADADAVAAAAVRPDTF